MTAVTQAVSQIRSRYKLLGIKPPATLFAEFTDVETKLGASLRHDPADLAAAVADAQAAGVDPALDEKVREQLARRQLAQSNLSQHLQPQREQRQLEVLNRHAPELLADLGKVVAAADATLVKARHVIGGLHLDADYLGAVPVDKLSLWGEAREAAQKVHAAADLWAAIITGTERLQQIPHGRRPLIIADLSYRDLDAVTHGQTYPAKPADVIEAGHPLSLAADAEEFTRRCKRIDRERQDAAAQAHAEQEDASRRAWAMH
jgi:hypothetical protein